MATGTSGLQAMTPLPQYKCHKKVWALKIKEIRQSPANEVAPEGSGGTWEIVPEDQGYAPIVVAHSWVTKHEPQPGGYWVQYDTGYTSFSPAEAFEEGYTRIGLLSAPRTMRFNPEMIAEVAHGANLAFCLILGDDSQPEWMIAPDWQKDSARKGVEFHLSALLTGRDPSPSESHENWLTQKLAEGWKYGPVKDPEKKEHPCCVPYEQLPIEQRQKDYLFAAIVRAFYMCHLADGQTSHP